MSIPKKRRPKTGRRTARRQFSCCKKIRPPPADRCSPNHVTEAASEFTPPHIYTKVACTAKRNFDHECKKTFATKSANRRHPPAISTARVGPAPRCGNMLISVLDELGHRQRNGRIICPY